MHDVWFGRFVGRWYPNANSRIELDLSYGDGNQDSASHDMFAANWGLRYDHGLSKGWSAFAGYRGGWFENDDNGGSDDGDWKEHTVLIGIRYSFGGLGVKANDRKGAGLDLPNYMRWAAAGETLD